MIDYGDWFKRLPMPLIIAAQVPLRYVHNYGIRHHHHHHPDQADLLPADRQELQVDEGDAEAAAEDGRAAEKYKNDRDAMNKAVMELYKTHKVNPMGGCLPMVVQIPVFFGLYRALMYSIELRHAPFISGSRPLCQGSLLRDPDRHGRITMFIQQKMTPSNMDPVQAKMMLACRWSSPSCS